jgi:hypothetical protein
MQHDYCQLTSYPCLTLYAGSFPIVLRCVRLYERWYGSCISPPYVAALCPSSHHLVSRCRYCVLLSYFYGDAIFSRCVAMITAWSCIVTDFIKQRNAYLTIRLESPWKRVYCCHNNACWELHCRSNFLLQCGWSPLSVTLSVTASSVCTYTHDSELQAVTAPPLISTIHK